MKRSTALLCALATSTGVLASPTAARADFPANFITQNFEARTYTDAASHVLPYRVFKPAGYGTAGKKFPIVIFFHGAGGRGTDNMGQLTDGGGPSYALVDPANQTKWPAFVIAPQCAPPEQWVAMDWGATSGVQPATPTWGMASSMAVLDALLTEFPTIDASRQYVMGLSMGGYATWDAITRWPQRFAKAVPICGGGDETKVAPIVSLPIWAFNSSDDGTVPAVRSEHMVAAIDTLGGAPLYTEYCTNGLGCYGHGSWGPAMAEPGLLPWLFDCTFPGAIACKSKLAGMDGTGGACAVPHPDGGACGASAGSGGGAGAGGASGGSGGKSGTGGASAAGGGAGTQARDAGSGGASSGAGGSIGADAAAGDETATEPGAESGSCGCRVPMTPGGQRGALLLLGLGALLVRRRYGAR
jgi:MYXO-CTERM domain-containing protein